MRYPIGLLAIVGFALVLRASETTPPPNPSANPLKSVPVPAEKGTDGPPPDRAIFRSGSGGIRGGIPGPVAVSPDGKRFATHLPERGLFIWEAESGRILERIDTHPEHNTHLTFSPDGNQLIYIEAAKVKRFNLMTRKVEAESAAFPQHFLQLAYSRDGKQIAVYMLQFGLTFLSAETLESVQVLDLTQTAAVYSFSLSRRGDRMIGTLRTGRICLWNVAEKKMIREIEIPGNNPRDAFLLGDGERFVVASHTGEIRIFDWDGETAKHTIPSKSQYLLSCRDEKSVASVELLADQTARVTLIDLDSRKAIHSAVFPTSPHAQFLLSPDGHRVYSYGPDLLFRTWNLQSGKEESRSVGHDGPVTGVGFTADGNRAISASQDGTVRFWDLATGKEVQRLTAKSDYFQSLAVSPDGNTLALGASPVRGFIPHRGGLGIKSEATGEVGHLHLWDLRKEGLLNSFNLPGESIVRIDFFAEGKRLMTLSGDSIRFRDVATGREEQSISLASSWGIHAIASSLDGRFIATSTDEPGLRQIGKIAYWDPKTGKEIFGRNWRMVGFSAIAFSPDGTSLAVAGSEGRRGENDSAINLWKVPTDTRKHGFEKSSYGASHLKFSPDGRLLAAVYPSKVIVYEVATGSERLVFPGQIGEISSLAFSRDSKRLVTGAMDGQVVVWDLIRPRQNGKLLPVQFDERGRGRHWSELTQLTGPQIDTIVGDWVATPEATLRFLKEKLVLAPKDTASKVTDLLKQLNSENFKTRELAARELEALGAFAVGRLQEELKENVSDDARDRIAKILKAIGAGEDPRTSSAARRALRVIEILERIGNREARELLADLVSRATEVVYQREASEALKRLDEVAK